MIRAEAGTPIGRARFTELSLLVWVATLAITGFVAVLATETSSFRPAAVVVPVVFVALMLALHVFLVGIRFRGDQILMPIAAGLTAIGLILVQRLASDLLLPDRIRDRWLRELTEAAAAAQIPVLLGGHSLVGTGIRLVLAPTRLPTLPWT